MAVEFPMDDAGGAQPSEGSQRGLDWLNFFIADVQTGFGPFVALYLASHNWTQGEIGLLLTVGGIAAIASQVPGGALVDWVSSKRLLIGGALALIALSGVILAFFPDPFLVFTAEVLHGSTGGVIRPALAAIGLGLVGHRALSGRLGRNHRYDAFGNALTAALMGVLAHVTAQQAAFLLAAALCLPAGYALTRIRGQEIDYARARSARNREKPREAARLPEIMKNRPLLAFVGSLVIFQFADASVMPLASERLGQEHQHESELVTAALIVVPQVITGLVAAWVARRADEWGRKPLLLIGYGVLPIRAALFALAPAPWYLIAIEALGGLTAAVIGIMTRLVIADVTRGIGASVSTTASGYVAQLFGYTIGFFGLAAVALIGAACVYWFLPETKAKGGRAGSVT